jgi:hypothetical protein
MLMGCYSNLDIVLSGILDEALEKDGNKIDSVIALHGNLLALHRVMEGSHVAQVNQ